MVLQLNFHPPRILKHYYSTRPLEKKDNYRTLDKTSWLVLEAQYQLSSMVVLELLSKEKNVRSHHNLKWRSTGALVNKNNGHPKGRITNHYVFVILDKREILIGSDRIYCNIWHLFFSEFCVFCTYWLSYLPLPTSSTCVLQCCLFMCVKFFPNITSKNKPSPFHPPNAQVVFMPSGQKANAVTGRWRRIFWIKYSTVSANGGCLSKRFLPAP